MSDSNAPDALDAKHEQNRQRRIKAIKRWVEYIKTEPPEKWGPQQNMVVDGQLTSAQHAQISAKHRQHVKDVADELADIQNHDNEAQSNPAGGATARRRFHRACRVSGLGRWGTVR